MLFVPGDRPERFAKAEQSDADAIILDLEDSVALEHRAAARSAIAQHLRAATSSVPRWVRINPVFSPDFTLDLEAVVPARPAGVLLPKARNGADVETLDRCLAELERAAGWPMGGIQIIPLITETAGALLAMGTFVPSPPRVLGMTWGAEDLATELGAAGNRNASGEYEAPYQLASSLCLITAAAAGVLPIDTVDTEIRDLRAVERRARASRRAGYVAKMAIHPAQIAPIHAAFTPGEAEVAEARRVIEAFANAPASGALRLDGKLIDRPHRLQAERVIAAAARAAQRR